MEGRHTASAMVARDWLTEIEMIAVNLKARLDQTGVVPEQVVKQALGELASSKIVEYNFKHFSNFFQQNRSLNKSLRAVSTSLLMPGSVHNDDMFNESFQSKKISLRMFQPQDNEE